MHIKLHYKINALEVLGVEHRTVITVETKNGATEVVLTNGCFYVVHESPSEVIDLINKAYEKEATK